MRLIDYTLDTDDLYAKHTFLDFADIHEGAAGVDYDLLSEDISCVKNNPYTYGWYTGDGTDAINKNDLKRFDFGAIHPYYIDPMHTERLKELVKTQTDRLCEHFAGVSDKILYSQDGNHGEKCTKQYGYDPDREFARFLGHIPTDDKKPVRYAPGVVIFRLTFRDGKHLSKPYLIASQHHCGGGAASVDSNLNWMERIMGNTWTNCDIYLTAHVHKRGSRRRSKIRISKTGKLKMMSDYQYFGVTGSYLRLYVDGTSNYGEGRYKPADLGALRVQITPMTGEINLY
jgi:hypothetical protein